MVPTDEKVNKMARVVSHLEEILTLAGNALNEDELQHHFIRIKPFLHPKVIRFHHLYSCVILLIILKTLEKGNCSRLLILRTATFRFH